jgi:hypothetical protein
MIMPKLRKPELRDNLATTISQWLTKINTRSGPGITDVNTAYGMADDILKTLPPIPDQAEVHAQFEVVAGSITGTASVPVKRVEMQDDGSVTVTLDFWPTPPTAKPVVPAGTRFLHEPGPELGDKRMSELTADQKDEATELWLRKNIDSFRHDTYRHISFLLDRLSNARFEALQQIAAAAAAPDPHLEQLLTALSDSGCEVNRGPEGDYIVVNKRADSYAERHNSMMETESNLRAELKKYNDWYQQERQRANAAEQREEDLRMASDWILDWDISSYQIDTKDLSTTKVIERLVQLMSARIADKDNLIAELRQKPLPPGWSFDNPDLDGTDGAHPAWWRAYDSACGIMCSKIEDILTGKDIGEGTSNPPWQPIRERLINLVQRHDEMHDKLNSGEAAVLHEIPLSLKPQTCVLGQDLDMVGIWEEFKKENPRNSNAFDAVVYGVRWVRKHDAEQTQVPMLNRKRSYSIESAWADLQKGGAKVDTLRDAVKFGVDWALKNSVFPAIGTAEGWGARNTRDGITEWVQGDSSTLPTLFSKEVAESLCMTPYYTQRRVLLVAYDVTEESK